MGPLVDEIHWNRYHLRPEHNMHHPVEPAGWRNVIDQRLCQHGRKSLESPKMRWSTPIVGNTSVGLGVWNLGRAVISEKVHRTRIKPRVQGSLHPPVLLALSTSRTSSSGSWSKNQGPTLVSTRGNHWQVPQHHKHFKSGQQPTCLLQNSLELLELLVLGNIPAIAMIPKDFRAAPFFAAVLCSITGASPAYCGACGAFAAAGRVSWVIGVTKTFSLTSHWPFFSSAFSWSFFMPFFLMA